jgi:RNA polymerase sigma-70 factor, ECF subfamily
MTGDGALDFQTELVRVLPNLRAFARSLSGNPDRADDLVQEAVTKAWRHRESFIAGTNLKAWLFTILRNVYLSELRKRKREVEDKDGTMAERLSVNGDQSGHMDLIDFMEALRELPTDQREALLLVGAEGYAYEEAALMCGCAVGTIKSRVSRARARLAELLGVESVAEFGGVDAAPPVARVDTSSGGP